MLNRLVTALAAVLLLSACATPRMDAVLGISYSDQPARVLMRWQCNGKTFTTQGTGVCEQKSPSTAHVSVKIPPLQGRVIYSNAQLKQTEDFNWAPKSGFWIWKKQPINDTWVDLELGELAATFGGEPIALDVAAVSDQVGVIVTRGMIYHRICNDQDVPCSKLVVKFECSGYAKATAAGEIGKCERMSGSPQAFRVQLSGPGYRAQPGARVYVSAARLGMGTTTYEVSPSDFSAGEFKLELPQVLNGPTIVGIRLAWVEGAKIVQAETRVLVVGFSPSWTGLDAPHWLPDGSSQLDFVRPVLSDALEVNLYDKGALVKKAYSADPMITFPKPKDSQVACAFAWQRESSDQTAMCLNANLEEVPVP